MWKRQDDLIARLTIRGYLVLLTLAIMVPVLVFAAILYFGYYNSELARIESELQYDARQLALTIDRDVAGLQYTAQTLSTATRIRDRDYPGFYEQAQRVRSFAGVNVLLRERNGQQVVNTRVEYGTPLPLERLASDEQAASTRRPVISGVILGAVAQQHVFTITVPIVTDDEVTHFLNLSLPVSRLVNLIQENLVSGRRAGVVDNAGLIMARSERFQELVGTPAARDFVAQARRETGVWTGTNTTGEVVRTASAIGQASGWIIYVSLPESAIRDSLRESFWAVTALGVALTVAALLLAYVVGGRLAGSMQVLSAGAAQLGRGERVAARTLPVAEISAIGNAISTASVALAQREGERDKAITDLQRLSDSLEKMVSDRTRELVDEMARRERAEETLRQAQKMDAIGKLTGGIAHDFNNMLAVVLGNLELAKRRLAKGVTSIDQYLTGAQEGGKRAAALTQRLLAFSRQQPLAPAAVDANKLVSGMSEMLRRTLGEAIRVETVLAGGLWRIHADPNELENALLNLAVNARDAMPDGGKLTIETANAHLDDNYVVEHTEVPAGQYVMLAVTDTGAGMTGDVAAKAFDPFFTTKKSGIGTGLGLSQVYGFVKQSGGHVKIYTELGEGTAIKVYLPRYFGAAEPARPAIDRGSLPTNDGSVSILVVEDEDAVRRYSTDALRDLGYRVLEADGARQALDIIDAEPDIAILFTDVVMPDMNGRRLVEAALARRPALKVLFTTGYTRNAIVHNGMLDPGVVLLSKPFTLEELARKMAELTAK
ncbi:MAG TPA: ATP-binding protein [Xanthobacteraceae bacterium]|nr:ATP-binding protein [Xanthobacteraceae bacterium]